MSTSSATLETASAAHRPGAPPSTWPDGNADSNRIKLSWLLRLHWGAIAGQSLAIAAAHWVFKIDVPLIPLFSIVALEVVANVGLEVWLGRMPKLGDGAIAAAMLFDAACLTMLLALSGGTSNPFATLYLVNIAIAAMLLDATWAWVQLGASLAMFGSLFALEHFGAFEVLSALERGELSALHAQGSWAAFVVAAAFIVYIVQQIRSALASLQVQLSHERGLSARKDKVASLATLAAGAAHELSTPLSTIAVVVNELRRTAERSGAPQSSLDDLALVREQVARCRDILHHMSASAGENAGEPFVSEPITRLIESVLAHLPGRERVDVQETVDLEGVAVHGPPRGLSRALRALLKNALQASPHDRPVLLRLSVVAGKVRAEIIDQGPGMPEDILNRAGEPFFTTKVPGEGMGLGLFLTQTLAEQLGGGLELRSTPGEGTTAILELPVVFECGSGDAR
jgi:two-component system sensor histidine kinase RegB